MTHLAITNNNNSVVLYDKKIYVAILMDIMKLTNKVLKILIVIYNLSVRHYIPGLAIDNNYIVIYVSDSASFTF